jgi:uncharacterized coiled-coil protein SlyX
MEIPDSDVGKMSTSQAAMSHVIFTDVPEIYPIDVPIHIEFLINPTLSPSSKDTIGLYRVGWMSAADHISVVAVPSQVADASSTGEPRKLSVTFCVKDLELEDGEFYQFCYVVESQLIRGASSPFQFVADDYEIINENDAAIEASLFGHDEPADSFVHTGGEEDNDASPHTSLMTEKLTIIPSATSSADCGSVPSDSAAGDLKPTDSAAPVRNRVSHGDHISTGVCLEANAMLSDKDVRLVELQQSDDNLLITNKTYKEAIEKLSTQLQQAKDDHERERLELQDRVETLNGKLACQEQTYKEAVEKLSTQLQQVTDEHEREKSELQKQVETLSGKLASLEQVSARLTEQVRFLTEQAESEEQKTVELEMSLFALKNAQQVLGERCTRLTRENAKLAADRLRLQCAYTELARQKMAADAAEAVEDVRPLHHDHVMGSDSPVTSMAEEVLPSTGQQADEFLTMAVTTTADVHEPSLTESSEIPSSLVTTCEKPNLKESSDIPPSVSNNHEELKLESLEIPPSPPVVTTDNKESNSDIIVSRESCCLSAEQLGMTQDGCRPVEEYLGQLAWSDNTFAGSQYPPPEYPPPYCFHVPTEPPVLWFGNPYADYVPEWYRSYQALNSWSGQ